MILLIISSIIIITALIISVINFIERPVLPRTDSKYQLDEKVSILIPVRNEENNIEICLNSLKNLELENYEIIVLDDESSDGSAEIIKKFAEENPVILFLKGLKKEKDWIGKNWACWQLVQKASGNYLLFIDADVSLSGVSVSKAMLLMKNNDLALLSLFPTQIMKNLSAYLITPLMNWLLLSFLRLKSVATNSLSSVSAANGQFMLWKREAYFKIGGHKKVKDKIVEDVELARLTKNSGYKMMTLLGGNDVKCQMYPDFKSAFKGFTKNIYPGFKMNMFYFLLIISLVCFGFLIPFFVWTEPVVSLVLILLIISNKFFVSLISNQKSYLNILFHPFQMVVLFLLSLNSVFWHKTGKIEWKERTY